MPCGSPSMESMNAPPKPSSVKEPATSNGSPVAMYRSISVSEYSQKCSVALLAPRAIRPVAKSIRQWPSTIHRWRHAWHASFPSHLSAMRLAVTFAVKQEHGIAAKNQRTDFRTGQARLAINEISNRFGDRRNGDSRKIAGLHIGGGLHFVRTQRNTMMF